MWPRVLNVRCTILPLVLWISAALPGLAATFTVTSTGGSGPGTLSQAVMDANANPGPDTIVFNIPGTGVQSISVFSQTITDPVTIDGTTQPGFAGAPLIEILGNFTLNTSNCTLKALVINTYPTGPRNPFSFGVKLGGTGGHVVTGCYIGTNPSGTARKNPIGHGVMVDNCANNTVGGTTVAARNLLSGNSGAGVIISGPGASNNIVSGNYIGTDINGTNQVPNNGSLGSAGVMISNAPANTLGGATAGAGNLISGNVSQQVLILGAGATGNVVQGNRIGLRPDGTGFFATRSSDNGVKVDNAPGNTIGGAVAGAGNVVANYSFGLLISGSNAVGNVVQGNFIGTDASGSVKVPNHIGIYVSGGGSNLIGGAVAGAGNLISGNEATGLDLANSSGNVVQGNLIGTDVTGMRALGNTTPGTQGEGFNINSLSAPAMNNLVGGTSAAARNVISGNNDAGITLFGTTASSNLIQGNYIGVAADGTTALGNSSRGIQFLGAADNLIGGAVAGAGNVLANNGLDGVWLAGTFGAFGTAASNNLVQGNLIYSNGAASLVLGGWAAGVTLLGPNVISSNAIFRNVSQAIDIGGDGPTTNSPSNPANYPEFTSAVKGSVIVSGNLLGRPNCKYRIEVFDDSRQPSFLPFSVPDSYVGSFVVMTDPSGVATFQNVSLDYTLAQVGDQITATATSIDCDPRHTSEESRPISLSAGSAGSVYDIARSQYSAGPGPLTVTVTRSGDTSSAGSVLFQTSPGAMDLSNFTPPAFATNDYLNVNTTLSFAPGQTSQTVDVQIANNNSLADRIFTLTLSNPRNGTIGRGTALVTIAAEAVPAPPALRNTLAIQPQSGQLSISASSRDQLSVAIEHACALWGPYKTIGIVPPNGGPFSVQMDPDEPQSFYRAFVGGPVQEVKLKLSDPAGAPAQNITVQFGEAGQVVPPDAAGHYTQSGFPWKRFSMRLTRRVPVTGPRGTINYDNFIDVEISNLVQQAQVDLKVDYEAETISALPCECTPWCAIAGGLVNGVQTVIASGGANGFCLESPEVTITGPGGVNEQFPAMPFPRRKRDTFSPAANGTWTVTTTICGKTKSASITLP